MKIKQLTVAQDAESSDECLYIDGVAWKSRGEVNVYAGDIAEAAGDSAIIFKMIVVDGPDSWPDTLAELNPADAAKEQDSSGKN